MVPEKIKKEVPVPATVVDRGLTSVTRFLLTVTLPVRIILYQVCSLAFIKFNKAIDWLQAKPLSERLVLGLVLSPLVVFSVLFTGVVSPSFSVLTVVEGILLTILVSWYACGFVNEK